MQLSAWGTGAPAREAAPGDADADLVGAFLRVVFRVVDGRPKAGPDQGRPPALRPGWAG